MRTIEFLSAEFSMISLQATSPASDEGCPFACQAPFNPLLHTAECHRRRQALRLPTPDNADLHN